MLSNRGPLSAIMVWGFQSYDDVFPYEFGDIFVFDARLCFSFHSFIEAPKVGTCEGPFVQVPPNQGETGGLHPDLVCLLGILGQSACPEVPYNVVRPLLVVCLFCLNGIASGSFDERVGLHMYRQQYGFFDGEEVAMPAKALRPFSIRLIFRSPSLETDRAVVRSNHDRMTSYFASLLEAGTLAGWLAPDVLLLGIAAGALPRILMIGRLHRLAKSTILFHLHEVSHHLAFHGQLGMLRRGWSSTTTGGLGIKVLAPSLNIWFLRLLMLC
ncbi:hypothetical protein AAG906_026283 [Vitis piasezkii]